MTHYLCLYFSNPIIFSLFPLNNGLSNSYSEVSTLVSIFFCIVWVNVFFFLCVGYKRLYPYNIVFLLVHLLVSHNHTKTHTLYSIYNIFFFIMQMVANFSTFSIFILLDKKGKSLRRSCKFSGYWTSASSIFYIAIFIIAFMKPLLLYWDVSSTHLR